MNQTNTSDIKHYWLYVLALEDDCYYIGITSRHDPQKRIDQHKHGFYTARWVRKHKYTHTVAVFDIGNLTTEQVESIENKYTLQYMKMYGLQKVRGGKYSYSGKIIKFGRDYWQGEWFEQYVYALGMMIVLAVAVAAYILK